MVPNQSGPRKVVLLGEPAVGKTSLRLKFMGDSLNPKYMATIGADFSFVDHKGTKLSIWDVAGEPNFKNIRSQFYSGSEGAILLYDITREKTLKMIPEWVEELFSNSVKSIPLILVGNKEDLRKKEDTIPTEKVNSEISKMNDELGYELHHYNSSALSGFNVKDIFNKLVKLMKKQDQIKLDV